MVIKDDSRYAIAAFGPQKRYPYASLVIPHFEASAWDNVLSHMTRDLLGGKTPTLLLLSLDSAGKRVPDAAQSITTPLHAFRDWEDTSTSCSQSPMDDQWHIACARISSDPAFAGLGIPIDISDVRAPITRWDVRTKLRRIPLEARRVYASMSNMRFERTVATIRTHDAVRMSFAGGICIGAIALLAWTLTHYL